MRVGIFSLLAVFAAPALVLGENLRGLQVSPEHDGCIWGAVVYLRAWNMPCVRCGWIETFNPLHFCRHIAHQF
jgi:hypothetical protein